METFLTDNWLSVAILCIQGVWSWVLWSMRKQFVSAETYDEARKQHGERMGVVENDVSVLVHRMDMVEREVRALPAIEKSMNDLGISVERVRGELAGLRAETTGVKDGMKGVERQLSLLMENELRGTRDER